MYAIIDVVIVLKCLTSFSPCGNRGNRQSISHMAQRRPRRHRRRRLRPPKCRTCRNSIVNNIERHRERTHTHTPIRANTNGRMFQAIFSVQSEEYINNIVLCDKSVANINILVDFYDSILFHFISPQASIMSVFRYQNDVDSRSRDIIVRQHKYPSIYSMIHSHYYVPKDIDRLTILSVIEKIILSVLFS